MHTWTTNSTCQHTSGQAETPAQAWQAAHAAAADIVRTGELKALTLEVDGQQATLRPADSGERASDIAAALEVIEAGRVDVVAAHEAITGEVA